MKMRARRGQTMVEYMVVFAALLVVAGLLWGLVKAAQRQADRTEQLVTMDCP